MTKQEKARWLSEMYAAMADGKELQYFAGENWYDVKDNHRPDFFSYPSLWRIKQEPRSVVRSVVGCASRSDGHWVKVPDDWPADMKVRVTEIFE